MKPTVAKIFDIGLLRLIDQNIAWVRLCRVVTQLRDEAGFRDVEVATPLIHFLSCLISGELCPLCYHAEVARYLEQRIEDQGPCFSDCLFHRQHANEVIAYA